MSVVEISNSECKKMFLLSQSDPDYLDVNEFISKKLHTKIFKELKELNYKGMVIYSGYVEPLLDKKIYECIAEARECLQKLR